MQGKSKGNANQQTFDAIAPDIISAAFENVQMNPTPHLLDAEATNIPLLSHTCCSGSGYIRGTYQGLTTELCTVRLTEVSEVQREGTGLWEKNEQEVYTCLLYTSYRKCENYDALLRVIRSDAGILLASLKPEDVLNALDNCPAETLKAYPFAILVLMRRMFTWRQIPKMLELKALLLTAIAEHPELSKEERGNLLGECDLILSFLCYNDICLLYTSRCV